MGKKKIFISKDQASLPFASRGGGGLLAYATRGERRVLAALAACFVVSVVLYVYFVLASVGHVAARAEMMRAARSVSTDVVALEADYLARSKTITEGYARGLGFVSVKKQKFVERSRLVSLNGAP